MHNVPRQRRTEAFVDQHEVFRSPEDLRAVVWALRGPDVVSVTVHRNKKTGNLGIIVLATTKSAANVLAEKFADAEFTADVHDRYVVLQ